jgi:hypothetical protein
MAETPQGDALRNALHVLQPLDWFTWVDFTSAGTNQAVPLTAGVWELSLVDAPSGYVFGAYDTAAVIPSAKTEKLGIKIAPGEPRLVQGGSWQFYMPTGSGRLLCQKVS